jgi:hypothetical protein
LEDVRDRVVVYVMPSLSQAFGAMSSTVEVTSNFES